jgi:predicted HTH domain antitoxin
MGMISDSSAPPCPYCSSVQVIKKGKAIRKFGYKQVYYCKICHKRYCEKKKKPEMELKDDIIESYLFNEGSLDSLIGSKGLTISRTTLYRRILEKAKNCPDWPELTADMKTRNILGSIMGVDTTKLKIEGKHHVYFHTVDVASGNPIAYDICEKEDIATIEPILQQLKLTGYYPKITVTDLAPELITSIERVFPNAKIQGCLFHLKMWLDKELPTKKHLRGIDQQTVKRWQEVKKLTLFAAYSNDWEKRREYLSRLKNVNLDEKAQSVVERFSQNIIYYNTLNRLKEYTDDISKVIYNNLCERHIGLVRKLESKRAGFKSINSAYLQVKSFWFYYIKRKGQLPHNTSDDKIVYIPPLQLFDHVNLEELATATGFPRDFIEQSMREKGYEIIDGYLFTKTQLEEIREEVAKIRKTSLAEIAKILGYDRWTMLHILQKVGIKILYSKLDLSDAVITLGNIQDFKRQS